MTTALETKGLEKQFGGLKVTRDLSLKVAQGARHALIGPNGAGKTTVINLLTGVLKPMPGASCLKATTSPICPFTPGYCAAWRAPSRSTSSMPT
jgi:ABC-type branched-subunit amino acid transport system ATPase component